MARQQEADDEAASDSDLALELERELERQDKEEADEGDEANEGVASCLKRDRPSSVGEEKAEDGDVKRAKILEEERLLRKRDSIATSTSSKAKPPPPPPPPSPGLNRLKGKASRLTLVDLAPEVLHRVLAGLSAQDLSACAQVSIQIDRDRDRDRERERETPASSCSPLRALRFFPIPRGEERRGEIIYRQVAD